VEDRVHGEKGNDLLKGVLVSGAPEVADGGSGHNTLYLALPTRPSGKPWHHVMVDLLHGRLDADGSVTHFSGLFTDLLVLTHQTATDWAVKGTNEAYAEVARPTADITLPMISEHTIGQLLQMLMLATVVEGRLMGTNPYGQPGVQAYKTNMIKHLKATPNLPKGEVRDQAKGV